MANTPATEDVIDEVIEIMENRAVEKAENRKAKAVQDEILDRLAVLGGRTFNDDDILFQGSKLVIPEGMSINQAKRFLEKKEKEQETVTNFSKVYNYRPWDGAVSMYAVLKETFGSVAHKDGGRGMFGPEPPAMITVPTGVGTAEQIPWGRFELPFLPGVLFGTDQVGHAEKGPLFALTAEGPKKYRYEIQGIFHLVEKHLAQHSMYRGKAFDGQAMPEFIDVFSVDRSKVVYSEDVMRQLTANIWSQLRHTEECERIGMPLKRAVLIHGPFGTGKTLAAMLTGQEAVSNGWTFIKARPGRDDLASVLQTARLYEPAVVFYEDIDVIASSDDDGIQRLLDDFDGIEAKGTKILCVLTTNYPEKIHKGMARPGRLDAMIEINELDQRGVQLLVEARISDMLAVDIDWAAVYESAEGYKPAFVTEAADRTIRYMLAKHGKINGTLIDTDDLVSAMHGLRPQFDVMTGAKDQPERDNLAEALKPVIRNVIQEHRVNNDSWGELVPFDSNDF